MNRSVQCAPSRDTWRIPQRVQYSPQCLRRSRLTAAMRGAGRLRCGLSTASVWSCAVWQSPGCECKFCIVLRAHSSHPLPQSPTTSTTAVPPFAPALQQSASSLLSERNIYDHRRLRRFASPTVEPVTLLTVGVAYLTSISVVALVPIDVFTALIGLDSSKHNISTLWTLSYWCDSPSRQLRS